MLVSGGFSSSVALAGGGALAVYGSWDATAPVGPRAEVWSPGTNTWRAVTGLNKQRTEFVLVGLRDGRALVAGGLNEGGRTGQSYSSACVFDLRAGHDGCERVGLMTVARTAPAAALLPDGRVLVTGGYFNTGDLLDSTAGAGLGASLAAYRPGAASSAAPAPVLGDVWEPPHGYALASAEIFDPATGTWSATSPMRYARVSPAIVTLVDGRVMVVGSSGDQAAGVHSDAYLTAEVYDPGTGRWTLSAPLPRIDHAAVRAAGVPLPDDEGAPGSMGTLVPISGGGAMLLDNDRWWKHTADVVRTFRFDPASNAWRQVGATCASARDDTSDKWLRTGSCSADDTRVVMPDGYVVGLGGGPLISTESDEGRDHRSARLVDAASGRVTPLPSMPNGRYAESALALSDGSILVIGGIGADGEYATGAIRLAPR